jgi:hypothetical protein
MSSPFNSPNVAAAIPSAPSIPGRMSLSQNWQHYSVAPPSTGCDSRSTAESNDVGAFAMGDPLSTTSVTQSLNPMTRAHDNLGYVMSGQYAVSDSYHAMFVPGTHSKTRDYSNVRDMMPHTLGDRHLPVSAMGYANGSPSTTAGQGYPSGGTALMSPQSNLPIVGYQWTPHS